MSEWGRLRRETGLIEHICEHGVGHPNAGSMARLDDIYGPGSAGTWGIHGCDGCCQNEDFPGNVLSTLLFAYQVYKRGDILDKLREIDPTIVKYLTHLQRAYNEDDDYQCQAWIATIGAHMFNLSEAQIDEWKEQEEFVFWACVAAERYRE